MQKLLSFLFVISISIFPYHAFFHYTGGRIIKWGARTVISNSDFPCPDAGYFSHPVNCSKFYRCVDFTQTGTFFSRYLFECPSGQIFKEEVGTCMSGHCHQGLHSVITEEVTVESSTKKVTVVEKKYTEFGIPAITTDKSKETNESNQIASEPEPQPESEPKPQSEQQKSPELEPNLQSAAELKLQPQSTTEPELQPESEPKPQSEQQKSPKPEPNSQSTAELKPQPEPEPEPNPESEPKPQPEHQKSPEPEPEKKSQSAVELKPQPQSTSELEPQPESEPKPQSEPQKSPEPEPNSQSAAESNPQPQSTSEPEPQPKSKPKLPQQLLPHPELEPKPYPNQQSFPRPQIDKIFPQTDIENNLDKVTEISTGIENNLDNVTEILTDIGNNLDNVTEISTDIENNLDNVTEISTDIENNLDNVTEISTGIENNLDNVTEISTSDAFESKNMTVHNSEQKISTTIKSYVEYASEKVLVSTTHHKDTAVSKCSNHVQYIQNERYCNLFHLCGVSVEIYSCHAASAFSEQHQMCTIAAADKNLCVGKELFVPGGTPRKLPLNNIGALPYLNNEMTNSNSFLFVDASAYPSVEFITLEFPSTETETLLQNLAVYRSTAEDEIRVFIDFIGAIVKEDFLNFKAVNGDRFTFKIPSMNYWSNMIKDEQYASYLENINLFNHVPEVKNSNNFTHNYILHDNYVSRNNINTPHLNGVTQNQYLLTEQTLSSPNGFPDTFDQFHGGPNPFAAYLPYPYVFQFIPQSPIDNTPFPDNILQYHDYNKVYPFYLNALFNNDSTIDVNYTDSAVFFDPDFYRQPAYEYGHGVPIFDVSREVPNFYPYGYRSHRSLDKNDSDTSDAISTKKLKEPEENNLVTSNNVLTKKLQSLVENNSNASKNDLSVDATKLAPLEKNFTPHNLSTKKLESLKKNALYTFKYLSTKKLESSKFLKNYIQDIGSVFEKFLNSITDPSDSFYRVWKIYQYLADRYGYNSEPVPLIAINQTINEEDLVNLTSTKLISLSSDGKFFTVNKFRDSTFPTKFIGDCRKSSEWHRCYDFFSVLSSKKLKPEEKILRSIASQDDFIAKIGKIFEEHVDMLFSDPKNVELFKIYRDLGRKYGYNSKPVPLEVIEGKVSHDLLFALGWSGLIRISRQNPRTFTVAKFIDFYTWDEVANHLRSL